MLNSVRLNLRNATLNVENPGNEDVENDMLEKWHDLTDLANKKLKYLIQLFSSNMAVNLCLFNLRWTHVYELPSIP